MTRARVSWMAVALACALLLASCASPAQAVLLPDPGGTGAWGAGLALLADPAGPLAAFDQPARLGFGDGSPTFALAASRATWFGVPELARSRVALRFGARALALAVGAVRLCPAEARLARVTAAAALRLRHLDAGAAWHEARGAGALDAGLATATSGDGLAFALAARAIASGGDPRARPEPDWTLEGAWRRGHARMHLALTRDLVSTRAGGGVALERAGFALSAGAFGSPWAWTLALSWNGRIAGGGYARAVHPVLGASEQAEARVAW